MFIVVGVFRKYFAQYTREGLEAYADAGNIAEEALGSIRTVAAFMAHDKLSQLYNKLLMEAERLGIKKQLLSGVALGLFQLIIYGLYALAFFYGGILLGEGQVSPGDIITVFLSVVIGAFSVAGSSGEIQAMGFAAGAATKLFEPIDRDPLVSSASEDGLKPKKVEGHIAVDNVSFRYPARPETLAVKDMTFTVHPGKTVALVGASGSGKSTIVQLIERFYDPEIGSISIDRNDLKELNVKWLRRQIGYVTQEPVLFKGTIWENVSHGLIGTEFEFAAKELKMQKSIEACKSANAHDFIMKLPDQYETRIGERGLLLSGGQKQRIAIARAIVKQPKILLLDEATSALDTNSEKVVQEALDLVSKGRSTIVIAHRLSTIRNANTILVMQHGNIIERGTHKSLLEIENGYYKQLVEAQELKVNEETRHPSVKQKQEEEHSQVEVQVQKSNEEENLTKNWGFFRVFTEVMRLNKPEWRYTLIGLIGAAISGMLMPTFAIIFGNVIEVFYEKGEKLKQDSEFWSLMFFVFALVAMFSNFLRTYMFGYAGEKLTTRLRDLSFRAMMRQEIGWFDNEKNSVGSLTSSLSSGSQQVQNMSGTVMGSFLELCTSIAGAAIVALIAGWKLGLVVLSVLPLVILANKLRMDMQRKGNIATKEYYEISSQVACEAVGSIRTIAALTREQDVMLLYSKELETPLSIGVKHAVKGSALFATSQTISFLMNALAFWYGTQLFINDGYNIRQMFTVLMAVTFAAQSSGRVFSMLPDLGRAALYAKDIIYLLNRKPRIDSYASGEKLDKSELKGLIEFKKVEFEYPTRRGTKVLQGLDLKAGPGKYIALVGASGCGKSTTVGLLERFYDVTAGHILIDDHLLEKLEIRDLRKIVSIVSQEPNLFNMSVRENILLGVPQDETVSQEDILNAAKMANIHDFIMELPQAYDTRVGPKGGQLSGGQRQRIAIARSLVLNPKVLLLDESTSALDAESERIVQAALDKARKGRTTIAIAHRLSTIKHADVIYVFDNGVVVESGTHEELIALNGIYNALVAQQNLK